MTKRFCDMCNKEITSNENYIITSLESHMFYIEKSERLYLTDASFCVELHKNCLQILREKIKECIQLPILGNMP